MGKPKKPRNKKHCPRAVAHDPVGLVIGGMKRLSPEALRVVLGCTDAALASLIAGTGTRRQWDDLLGAVNIGTVLIECNIAEDYRAEFIYGRNALHAVGARYLATGAFSITPIEAQLLTTALEVHGALVELCRVNEIEMASREVLRRLTHHDNTMRVSDPALTV